ncbi:hypothetical protein [Nocardia suismassiliense]|uniref:hypothetical protein n=1 Tax=Nocardia suismassiliense TaxID=2077092 RepID=UPI000D1F22F9|nr:hypothetical protein [Nocardia suismassiliense]
MTPTTIDATTTTAAVAPHCAPTIQRYEEDSRYISAIWNVGGLARDGQQEQIELYSSYLLGDGYSAGIKPRTLTPATRRMVYFRHPILLERRAAQRFHPRTLDNLLTTAIAELRRRFDLGDTSIVAAFTPTAVPGKRDHRLPRGWSIRIKAVMNVYSLTLLDADGGERHFVFHPRGQQSAEQQEVTIRRFAAIGDPVLRARARELVADYRDRVAAAQASVDAFSTTTPDFAELSQHLRGRLPGAEVAITIDNDHLTVILTLTATASAAGALLTLVTTWLAADELTAQLPAGITVLLGDDFALSVTLAHPHGEAFLSWYRSHQPAPVDNLGLLDQAGTTAPKHRRRRQPRPSRPSARRHDRTRPRSPRPGEHNR